MRMTTIAGIIMLTVAATGGVLAAELEPGESFKAACTSVIDGDTLVVEHRGRSITVDLYDIDAPELDQPWGDQARIYLNDLVKKRRVKVHLLEVYRDRTVAKVSVKADDLSDEMVCQGLAWALDGASGKLLESAAAMRKLRVGLWSQEEPVAPWIARRDRKTQ